MQELQCSAESISVVGVSMTERWPILLSGLQAMVQDQDTPDDSAIQSDSLWPR